MTFLTARNTSTAFSVLLALACTTPAAADEDFLRSNRRLLQQLDEGLEQQVKQAIANEATFASRNASQAKAVAMVFQFAPQVVPTFEPNLPNTNAEIQRVFRVTLTEAGAGFWAPFDEAGRVVDRSFEALSFREAQRGAGALALNGLEHLAEITGKVDAGTAAGRARAIVQATTIHDLAQLTANTLHRLGAIEQAVIPTGGQLVKLAIEKGSPAGNTLEAVKQIKGDTRPKTAQELKLLDMGIRLSAAVGVQSEIQMTAAREGALDGRLKSFESQLLDTYSETYQRELERMQKLAGSAEPTAGQRQLAQQRAFGRAVYEHAKQLLRLQQGASVTGNVGLQLRGSIAQDRLRDLQSKSLPELSKMAHDLGKQVPWETNLANYDADVERVKAMAKLTGMSEAEVRQRIRNSAPRVTGISGIVDPTKKRSKRSGSKGRIQGR